MENAQRFPRRGGRVLCVHGPVSFHRARPCATKWLPRRGLRTGPPASSDCGRPVNDKCSHQHRRSVQADRSSYPGKTVISGTYAIWKTRLVSVSKPNSLGNNAEVHGHRLPPSACIVNGRLRHTGKDAVQHVPRCVVARVSFYVLHTSSAWAHVGGPGGGGWKWSAENVVTSIENRTDTFFVIDAAGHRSNVGVVDPSNGRRKYLRTYADGDWNNNLLTLPECP